MESFLSIPPEVKTNQLDGEAGKTHVSVYVYFDFGDVQ